jgi:phage-related minor tail protein
MISRSELASTLLQNDEQAQKIEKELKVLREKLSKKKTTPTDNERAAKLEADLLKVLYIFDSSLIT